MNRMLALCGTRGLEIGFCIAMSYGVKRNHSGVSSYSCYYIPIFVIIPVLHIFTEDNNTGIVFRKLVAGNVPNLLYQLPVRLFRVVIKECCVKKFISLFKDPLLLVFIVIAAVMWYLNHLNATFMNDVTVPIRVRGMSGVDRSDSDGAFDVVCRVRGNGYTLMLMNLFPRYAAMELSASDLSVSSDPYDSVYYNVNLSSLERAISSQIKDVELVGVLNNEVRVRADRYAEKTVEVRPRIRFDRQGQYMQLGPVVLEPSSVVVKGAVRDVAAVDYVETMPVTVGVDRHDYVGMVELRRPAGVEMSVSEVKYNVDIDRFTEYSVVKKVEVRGADGDFVVLPSSVTVKCNVAVSRIEGIRDNGPVVYVDYGSGDLKGDDSYIGNDRYIVKVDGLIDGMGEVDISPRYVTVLREEEDDGI